MATSKRRKKKKTARPALRPSAAAPNAQAVRRLLDAGDGAAARVAADAHLAARPHDPQALNLAGIAAARTGALGEAASLFETALAFDPSFADARLNLGNALSGLGRAAEADSAYGRVLEAQPDHADALFNRALARRARGRFVDALADLDAIGPGFANAAEAAFARAGLLAALGRLTESRNAWDRALDLRPGWPDALTNRAAVLQELGLNDAASADLDAAVTADPEHTEARYNQGVAAQTAGDPGAAAEAYEHVLKRRPDHIGARINLAWAYVERGETDRALDTIDEACRRAPSADKAHVNRADILRVAGSADAALDAAEAYLRSHPGNPSMTAFLAVAAQAAGHSDRAAEILALDRAVQVFDVDWRFVPGADADFDAALGDHILAHPSLHEAPASHATRAGGHTGNLMVGPLGPMEAFAAAVDIHVDRYAARVSETKFAPTAMPRPERTGLHVWAVAMRRSGHQRPHNHPSAWISGVYYARTPDIADAGPADDLVLDPDAVDDAAHAGWIEFGRPPDDYRGALTPHVRLIRPRAGRMVLFPSFLFHRTVPHASDALRISVAFDVFGAD
jgi:tetratricopeptide (TPR) repeat protein